MIQATQAEQVANHLLKLAKQQQATAELSLDVDGGFAVEVRQGEVETVEHHSGQSLSLTLYKDQRVAHVDSTDISLAACDQLFAKALSIVRYAEADEYAGLADADRMAYQPVDCDLYHPWSITPTDAIELALACERSALGFSPLISQSEGAHVSSYTGNHWYANSHGMLVHYPASMHDISCSLIAEDQQGMQRDYDYTKSRRADDLRSVEEVAQTAAQNTVQRLDARQIPTGSYPVVFHHRVAKGLMGHFIGAIMGSRLYQKSSFLCDRLGQKIFNDAVTISQRPHLPAAMGSIGYDSDGVVTTDLDFVRQGELVSYALSQYAAKRLGMITTGNASGVYNCVIDMPTTGFDDLLKQMGSGLLITELMGQGINIVTGDYSRGAFGYWVENGEIQHAVQEITVASTLQQMFAGLSMMADDVDHRSNIRCGSLLVDQMQVAGS